jgi:hypothetical protein
MAIIILFFAVLAVFIAITAFAQRKSVRFLSAAVAFGWACLMFIAASWATSLDYNAWYSHAAAKMLDAYIVGIEHGHQDAVLNEMRGMTNELDVTYERRGNFKELAERAAQRLATNANHGSARDRR